MENNTETNNTKILIVDDEPINLDFFEVMLTKLGFIVEMAQDGEEALDRILDFRPDVMILDNIMPKLTGWEVTRIIKTHEDFTDVKDTPIIMFSAMDDVKDKVEGFELGVEDYITKPFNFSEVLARIRAVLRHSELQKQMMTKERHIARIESLSESLLYFTEHLKGPIGQLLNEAKSLTSGEQDKVEKFRGNVVEECEQVLAALGGLEDEIKELKNNVDSSAPGSQDIMEELEVKFQKQFAHLKESDQFS